MSKRFRWKKFCWMICGEAVALALAWLVTGNYAFRTFYFATLVTVGVIVAVRESVVVNQTMDVTVRH